MVRVYRYGFQKLKYTRVWYTDGPYNHTSKSPITRMGFLRTDLVIRTSSLRQSPLVWMGMTTQGPTVFQQKAIYCVIFSLV